MRRMVSMVRDAAVVVVGSLVIGGGMFAVTCYAQGARGMCAYEDSTGCVVVDWRYSGPGDHVGVYVNGPGVR